MAQLIPGRRADNWIDEYTKKLDAAVEKIMDRDIYIRGDNVLAFIEEDIDPADEFQKAPRRYILKWQEKHGANYRAGDQVTQGDKVFEIKQGYPVREKGCWFMAHLKTIRGTQHNV